MSILTLLGKSCQNEPTLAHFGTFKSYVDIVGWCFPVNIGSFWHCQKLRCHCWVMFSCERWLILALLKVILTLLGDVFRMFSCERWLILALSKVMLTLLGDVFLWTLAHFGIVGWCFPNVFLWTLAHFGTFKSYVDIVGWCFLVKVGSFWRFQKLCWHCWVMFSCEHWLITLARSKVMLTLLGDVFLWTLAHFGTVKSYVDIVGWCFPNVFLWTLAHFGTFKSYVDIVGWCFLVNVGSFWHFQKLCWHCWVMFSCEHWLILALSKVTLSLLGDVFLWTLAHFGTFKSYIDIVGWCFPNVFLWTLAHFGTFKSYVDIVGWCFPVNVGSFWHCWVMFSEWFSCERWLILALSKVMLTLLGDVSLWTLAHFGTFKSYVDIVGWCFPVNIGSFWHCQKLRWHCWVMFFLWTLAHFGTFKSYIDIVGWCFPNVFLWTLAHFGTFKSYVDIVGWCFPVNVGSFWHCQKLCWHCWVMFSCERWLILALSKVMLTLLGDVFRMFSCERWLILALSKVMLTLLGDVFLWTLAHFGTVKSYVDTVGWCFPNVFLPKWATFTLAHFGTFKSYVDIVGWCFLVNVGSFWHFQKLCWHCWVMFSCEHWLILALSKVTLTLLGDVFLWTLAHFGTFKSYIDIVGWCFPNVFLWTLAHFGTFKSYVDIVGWCFPNVFLWTLAHFGTVKSYVDIVGWCFPVNVGSFWHFQKLCWHCWVMFSQQC